MGAGVGDFGAATWLAALFGVSPLPTQYWVALASDEPDPQGDGDTLVALEPDPTLGYARQPYGTGTDNWVVDGVMLTNTNDITFGVPSDDWGPVNHFVLCDDPSSGDLYGWGLLSDPLNILAGAPVILPAGGLVVAITSVLASIAV